ncbi:gamma-glutamyltransferase [Stenotrophomonas sp. MMGLT7]|uniref:gamma-glutamyltransferase n=1 Tax=Stenotrophomonas sp. MMGLT7 TaxID=2901227 RepID=UPI001E3E0DD1|nr:gamma-glutamyltransferase [Stenotrophomonas sp. MMGLT7]MCD7097603.1 gamma-glutamyltransferase [Stenotrophomonas sp. MMGLT7]
MKTRACLAVVWGALLALLAAVGGGVQAQDTGDSAAHAALATYRPPVPGMEGLVTSANPLASAAGARILAEGGNAADAAVAVAATLNVVEPQSSGIGGNGYTMYYDRGEGRAYSLAMHGAAPLAVKPQAMTQQDLEYGMLASTTPGAIGGLIELLDRHGRLSLAQVLAPAIRYARDGHPANRSLVASIVRQRTQIERFPSTAAVFLPGGRPPQVGELFRQPAYAATLQKLVQAERGALAAGADRSAALRAAYARFYEGDIASEIDGFFAREGGLVSRRDLAGYRPHWDAPLHTTYRGYDVYANPRATRGGIEVLMQLNLIEGYDLKALGFQSPQALHLIAESIKLAKADIYHYVGDPAFTQVPWDGLLSKAYAAQRRRSIAMDRAMAYPAHGQPPQAVAMAAARRAYPRLPETYADDPDTTSFSIVDRDGNAVVCTPTVGGGFGAGVVVGDTGLLFNNGMRVGSTSPYADNVNALAPGKVPLLNNSPILVMKDGRLVLAIGTPGGESIGQTQFQGIVNVIDYGLDIQQAIEAPRIRIDAEPNFYRPGAATTIAMESRIPQAVSDALAAMGHPVERLDAYTPGVGGMQGILVDGEHGTMSAGADPRRAGYAIGW